MSNFTKREYAGLNETVYFTTLDNGLPVYVIKKPGFKSAYAHFVTNYGGNDRKFAWNGSSYDTPAGIAHYLEHTMFNMPDGSNTLQVLGMLGASPNAYTSYGETAYLFSTPHNFEQCLEVLLTYVSTPYFTKEIVDKERGIIEQEIKMYEDNPSSVMEQNLFKMLYRDHPVCEGIIGTVDSIAQIDADLLYACHGTFYNPANMVLCVSGDVDPDSVAETAERILPKERGVKPQRMYDEGDSLPSEQEQRVKMAVGAPIYILGGKALPKMPDTGAEIMRTQNLASLAALTFAGSTSKLYNDLYASGAINQSFAVGYFGFTRGEIVYAQGQAGDPLKVRDAIIADAERVAREGLDETEFTRNKKALIGATLQGFDNLQVCARHAANGHFYDYDSFDRLDAIAALDAADASRFIADNFKAERLALSMVEPA